jgi:hypothetical protein
MKNQNRRTASPATGVRREREDGTRSDGVAMRPQIRPLAGPPDDVNNFDLDPDEIRQRAYQLYLRRGGSGGSPEDDWLEAEQQLKSERGSGGGQSLAGF